MKAIALLACLLLTGCRGDLARQFCAVTLDLDELYRKNPPISRFEREKARQVARDADNCGWYVAEIGGQP